MNKNYKKLIMQMPLVVVLMVTASSKILADRTYVNAEGDCRTDFGEDGKTFLTLYGDSLGDFVDTSFFPYGFWGWEAYLSAWQPDLGTDLDGNVRPWDVQNLAVGSWTTRNVWDLLVENCSKKDKQHNYRTAKNVAIEIGGNDFKDNLAVLTYMPWKMHDVVGRVTYNTRVLVRALRHSRRDKNVLVMGNFPTIAKSPTMGNYLDYFVFFKHLPSGQMDIFGVELKRVNDEMKENLKDFAIAGHLGGADPNLALTFLFRDAASELANDLLTAIDNTINEPLFNHRLFDDPRNKPIKTGKDLWYWTWLQDNQTNPISHALSIAVFLHQPFLEQMVAEENALKGNVHFLPLHQFFIYDNDCKNFGHCFVANPELYSDIVHVNHIGYAIWSAQLAHKVKELGWHNNTPTTYTGLIKDPGTKIEEELKPEPVVVEPNPIDYALLWCLFTGACW